MVRTNTDSDKFMLRNPKQLNILKVLPFSNKTFKMQIKTYLVACLTFIVINNTSAQIELGLRFGISSTNLDVGDIIFDNKDTDIKLADAKWGHHLGVYTRIKMLSFYMEPALIFNSSQTNYSVNNYSEDPIATVTEESYLDLNIPILIGTKMGPFRLAAGPVAHVSLDKGSQLFNFDQYGEKTKETSYGYQLGLGLDIWSFRFDLNYENNLGDRSEKVEIFGAEFTNNTNKSRWIASVGIKF